MKLRRNFKPPDVSAVDEDETPETALTAADLRGMPEHKNHPA